MTEFQLHVYTIVGMGMGIDMWERGQLLRVGYKCGHLGQGTVFMQLSSAC